MADDPIEADGERIEAIKALHKATPGAPVEMLRYFIVSGIDLDTATASYDQWSTAKRVRLPDGTGWGN